ncbi:MAG: hypothetical protein WBF38_01600 [Nitrosotalea sp.]
MSATTVFSGTQGPFQSCTVESNTSTSGNIVLPINVVLTVPRSVTLTVNLNSNNILVENQNVNDRLVVQDGGKIK